MESLIKQWDGEKVIIQYDQPSGAWIFMAIHSTRLGPPVSGGTRMRSYPNAQAALQDAFKLSAAMTNKLALAGVGHGGGKVVIAAPPDLDRAERTRLLQSYGTLLQQLSGLFLTGPDMGTSPDDMDIIAETGAPYVFSRTPAAGGAGDSGPTTATGVLAGMRVTCERLYGDASLAGKRVLVQGAGSVGRALMKLLQNEGANVLFSDIDEIAMQRVRTELGLEFIPPESLFDTVCDIFSPCAIGGILDENAIARLKCQAVVGAANNQLVDPHDAMRLQERDILYAPDMVVNIGGLLGITGIEAAGWSWEEAHERVSSTVTRTLGQVYDLAAAAGLDTHAAALRIARERLAQGKLEQSVI
jgi:glutamate dehydrogenase/leucine dehydrogenase